MQVDDRNDIHPSLAELAAYLDGALPMEARRQLETHAAGCPTCRAEMTAAVHILRKAPGRRGRTFALPLGVAAAAALVVLLVHSPEHASQPSPRREAAVTAMPAPIALAPRGEVKAATVLLWSSVPRATRYRVLVADQGGDAVLRAETADTTLAIPDSVSLQAGASYVWKVEAEVGFGRWVASEMVPFTRGRGNR